MIKPGDFFIFNPGGIYDDNDAVDQVCIIVSEAKMFSAGYKSAWRMYDVGAKGFNWDEEKNLLNPKIYKKL